MILVLSIIGVIWCMCFLFMIYEIRNAEEINSNIDF